LNLASIHIRTKKETRETERDRGFPRRPEGFYGEIMGENRNCPGET